MTAQKEREVITTENKFESKEYKVSRMAYSAQAALEYFIALLVGGSFLVKVLSSVGASDAFIGIISSFASCACLIQILSIFVVKRVINTKKTVIIFDTLSQLFFTAIYFVPFINIGRNYKIALIVFLIVLAHVIKNLISSLYFKWANSFVDPTKRATYSAVKEIISLVGGIVVTLFMGYIIDGFEAVDNIKGGFLFIAVSMLILNVANFISLLKIKNEKLQKEENKLSIKDILANTIFNKDFINLTIVLTFYQIAQFTSAGFMGTFKINDLMLSVATVEIINMVANFIRVVLTKPIGKYSDRFSFANGMQLGYIFTALGFLTIFFTTPKNWWLIILYQIFASVGGAGTGQNSTNILYSYVKSEYFVHALAIKNCIVGICGFLASLAASRLLSYVQAHGNSFLGIKIYGQQLLALISFIIIIGVILFNRLVIMKQKRIVQ